MASENHVQCRKKADDIIAEVKKEAERQNKLYNKKLKDAALSAHDLIIVLQNDKAAVKQELESIENKEYYRIAGHENLVAFLYLSRLLCMGRDEERILKKCLLQYEKEKHINGLLTSARKQLPDLTFEDFLAGKIDLTIYETDENEDRALNEEVLKIRQWQTAKKIVCIKLEFGRLRDNFKKAIKDEIFPKDRIKAGLRQLRYIFSGAPGWNGQKLDTELKKVKALEGIGMPADLESFHKLFVLFLDGDDQLKHLTPGFFESATENIDKGRISGMPVFGLSLFMYYRWLMHIDQFKTDVFDREETSFEKLFSETYQEGQANKEREIESITKKCENSPSKGHKYESFLLQEIERQRNKFIRLEYTSFFDLIEQKDLLKDRFINDCLRSLNIELVKEELRQTIRLDETLLFLKEELYLLKHNPLLPAVDQLLEDALMLEIICHMAPDSELINCFLDIKDLIKLQISKKRIPLSFINGNANCLFPNIFEKAIEHFRKVAGRMSADDKGIFITDFLRDIEYMETLNVFQCIKKNNFFQQVKHILKSELKSAQRMKIFRPEESLQNTTKKEKTTEKHFTFGYHHGPKELMPIVKAMDLQMNIFTRDSTAEDFMEVLTCNDLSKCTKKIHLGLKTNLFNYFREKCELWAEYFTPARIEKSGIFISLNEGIINAHLLYNSKLILKEDSDKIDAIFNAKYK